MGFFLCVINLMIQTQPASAQAPRPAAERIAGARDVTIYKKEGVYACFPSLIRLKTGALYTSFGTRTRRSHIDPTGGHARYVSEDRGQTWVPYSGPTAIDPCCRNSDGTYACATAHGWREVPESRRDEYAAKNIVVRPVRPGIVAYLQGAVARRSTDGGRTWSSHELELPPHRSLMNYNQAARYRTRCGIILNAVYGQLADDKIGRPFVLRSDNEGKTWQFLPVPGAPNARVTLNETALIENDRGEIVAMIRSEPPEGGHLYQSTSKDGGLTWSTPQRTEIWGYPAHLLRLADGRILCTFGYRRTPAGVRAVLSDDGGRTWKTDHPIVIRDDHVGPGGDLGYPISEEVAPGKVFTIYYITLKDGVTHIAGTHWQLPAK